MSSSQVGFWASVGCLIHCTILPLLVPFIPALTWIEHTEGVEQVFWVLSAVTAIWQAFQSAWKLRLWFGVWAILGTLALFLELHMLLHIAFLGVAAGSCTMLYYRYVVQRRSISAT